MMDALANASHSTQLKAKEGTQQDDIGHNGYDNNQDGAAKSHNKFFEPVATWAPHLITPDHSNWSLPYRDQIMKKSTQHNPQHVRRIHTQKSLVHSKIVFSGMAQAKTYATTAQTH